MTEFNSKKKLNSFDGFNNMIEDSDSDNDSSIDYDPQEIEEEEQKTEERKSNNFEGFNNFFAENEDNDVENTNNDNSLSYYELFFAAFEEVTIIESNHSSNEDLTTLRRVSSKKSIGLFENLLKVVEKFNMPSLESSDNLSSMSSMNSLNSLSSFSSETDLKSLLSEGNYFKAVEKLYLNEKEKSSPNLQSLSSNDNNNTMISQFVSALEDFLQQSNQTI